MENNEELEGDETTYQLKAGDKLADVHIVNAYIENSDYRQLEAEVDEYYAGGGQGSEILDFVLAKLQIEIAAAKETVHNDDKFDNS